MDTWAGMAGRFRKMKMKAVNLMEVSFKSVSSRQETQLRRWSAAGSLSSASNVLVTNWVSCGINNEREADGNSSLHLLIAPPSAS